MRVFKVVSLVSALSAAAGFLGWPAVAPAARESLVQLSGPTPFGDCYTQPGTPANAETEPHLARNPRRPNNLIAAWQQDRAFGARGSVVASSLDGGRHWRRVVLPGADTCQPGVELVADHWITFDARGTAYIATLLGYDLAGGVRTRFIVNRSTDGGRTWSDPITVLEPTALHDKETLTADPNRSGVLYAAWSHTPVGQLIQDVRFSRSTDGGETWSEPTTVLPGNGRRAFVGRILVRPDGSLTMIAELRPLGGLCTQDPAPQLVALRSHDGGETWSQPVTIGSFRSACPQAVDHPKRVHGGFGEASAVDEHGRVYVVFSPQGGTAMATPTTLKLAVSDDGGATWTPRTVAELPTPAQLPTVAVDDRGAIGITWYDLRRDSGGDGVITTDYVLATANSPEAPFAQQRVATFDAGTVPPFSPGLPFSFLGDYVGLVGLNKGFGMAFTVGEPLATSGPSDVYFASARAPW